MEHHSNPTTMHIFNRYPSSPSLRTATAYCVLIASLTAIWMWLLFAVDKTSPSILKDIAVAGGALLAATLPYWWLTSRWRLILLWGALIPAMLVLPNIWYFRFWGAILSPACITMTENMGGALLESTLPLIRWYDFLLIPLGALPGIAGWLLRPLSWRPGRREKWSISILSVLAFGISSLLVVRVVILSAERSWRPADVWESAVDVVTPSEDNMRHYLFKGPVFFSWDFVGGSLQLLFDRPLQLSADERTRISRFIAEVAATSVDSAVADANRHKNLIIVVVESLNSDVIGSRREGIEITPTLNGLIRQPGTFSSSRIATQTKDGNSIDGQLLINTGLLPVAQGVTVNRAPHAVSSVPSLPRIFPDRDNAAVFATDGQFWHERIVSENLGYRQTYVLDDYAELAGRHGHDGGMFRKAEELIEGGLRSPFLLELITGSMHTPFVEEAAGQLPPLPGESELTRRYLTVTRYFDMQLGQFIDFLKRKGIYDDTMIVVVSDHTHDIEPDSGQMFGKRCFAAFINCGVSGRSDNDSGQANIFPTILALMGATDMEGYHGLADNLLSPELTGAVDGRGNIIGHPSATAAEGYRISELIWRGNYFHTPDGSE